MLADFPGKPLTEAQRRRADESLEQVLAKIAVPKVDEAAQAEAPGSQALRIYARARAAYADQDYRQTLALLEQAIVADDRFAAPYELLGRLYDELGRRDKMLEAMGKAVERDPRCVTALYLLGSDAMEQGKTDQAVSLLGRAYQVDDDVDPGMHYLASYQLGQALLASGRPVAAEQAMAAYLRTEGRFGRSTTLLRQVYLAGMRRDAVLALLGDAHLRMDDAAGALERYEQATQAADRDEENGKPALDVTMTARRIYAMLLLGRFEDAEQLSLDALADAPDADGALSLGRYVAAHTDQPQRFTKKLTDWYAQSQHGERMARAVAQVLPPADAEKFLVEHLAQSPTDMAAFRALVKLYGNDAAGRAKAVALTLKMIDQHPDQARQYVSAMLELNLSYPQFDAALKACSDQQRYSAAGWYLRGMVEQQAQNDQAAAQAFAKSLDSNPDFVPAQAATIEKQIADGDYQQAIQLIEGSSQTDHPRLQLLRAVALSRMGQTDQALAVLEPLVDKYPRNNEYLLAMAQLQRQQHQYDDAERTAQRMLDNDPTNEDAYELLFTIYEQDRPDATKFAQLLARARATIPTGKVTWRQMARYHLMRNETEQAESVLRMLVSHYPTDAAGLRDLVGLLMRGKRADDAEKLLTELLDKNPVNRPALLLLQQVTKQTNHPQVFYARMETFLKRLPVSEENYVQLAALYGRWGKAAEGIDAVNKALALKPNDAVPLYVQLCRLHEMAKEYDQAEKAIDQAIAVSPDRPALHAIKAWLLHEAKQDDRAVKVMTDAIGRFSGDDAVNMRMELARLYTAMDKIDLAMAQVDRVIASNPGNAASLYYQQAMMLYGKPDSQKLIEKLMLKSLASNPDFAPANNDLGYQWADQGVNLAKAEQMIRKAVAAEPQNSAYLDSMGWVQYKQGRFDQAVLWLHRATQYPGGEDPVVQDHLADAMWRTGQHDQAQRLWTDALAALEQEAADAVGRSDDDEPSPDHAKLLPVLKAKLETVKKGQEPVLAPVPDKPVEIPVDIPPPPQPAPAMQ